MNIKRIISYALIALVIYILAQYIAFPGVTELAGEPVQQKSRAVSIEEWKQFLTTIKKDTTLDSSHAPYKNPFVIFESVVPAGTKQKVQMKIEPSPLMQYVLAGIVANRAVTIMDKKGAVSVLKIGDTLEGAQLISIKGTSALFKGPGGEFTLTLP